MFDYLWGEIAIIVLGLWMGLIFVLIGVIIERVRHDTRQCDIDDNSGVCTTCGHRDRCKYNRHDKQKGAEK